jgi:hypothetical protein
MTTRTDGATTARLALMRFARWYATATPVMPLPTMQMSASAVSAPVLPSDASGFAPGAESVQKDLEGFGTGRDAGDRAVHVSRTCWTIWSWLSGTGSVGMAAPDGSRDAAWGWETAYSVLHCRTKYK